MAGVVSLPLGDLAGRSVAHDHIHPDEPTPGDWPSRWLTRPTAGPTIPA
jgi:hypothetical protein